MAEMVPCACGCGEQVKGWKKDGTPATYLRGHAMRGRTHSEEACARMSASKKGMVKSEEWQRRINEALRTSPNQKGKNLRRKTKP